MASRDKDPPAITKPLKASERVYKLDMRDTKDLYEILQVHHSAEPQVIEAAYRRLLRIHHPDVNSSPDAGQVTARLNAAYEVLSDPEKRAAYDRDMRHTKTDLQPRGTDVQEQNVQHIGREQRPRRSSVRDPDSLRRARAELRARASSPDEQMTRRQRSEVSEQQLGQRNPTQLERQRTLAEARLREDQQNRQCESEERQNRGPEELKANPNLDDALWQAAKRGDAESALALMYAGANPYRYPQTALAVAVEKGHTDVVKVITDVITQGIYKYPE